MPHAASTTPEQPDPQVSRAETAAYVAALSDDLAKLALRSGMPTLGYLLDMARLEAETLAQQKRESDGSGPGLRAP